METDNVEICDDSPPLGLRLHRMRELLTTFYLLCSSLRGRQLWF